MRKRFLLAVSLGLGVVAACTPAPSTSDNDGNSPGTGGNAPGGRASGGSGSGTSAGGQTGANTGGSSASGGSGAGSGASGSGAGGSGNAAGESGASGGNAGGSGAGGSGGGGGSGESADASPGSDTPSAPGPVAGGCAGAKKCFDFEDQMAGKPPAGADFTIETHGGSVTTDTTKSYSGKQSILIKTTSGGNWPGNNLVFKGIDKLLPDNDLHGRVMVWMDQTPGAAHFDSIQATGTGGQTYILGGMKKNFMSVYHPGDCSVDSDTPFPVATWACIQWEFKGSKDGKHLHKMMLNGQTVDKGIQDANQGFPPKDWKAPIFNQMKVGFTHYGNTAVSLWIDDLAFGDQLIACPPPKASP